MALRILKDRKKGTGDDEIQIKYFVAQEGTLTQLLFRAGSRIEGVSESIKDAGMGTAAVRSIWPARPDSLDDDVATSYTEWFVGFIKELKQITILVKPHEPRPFRSPEGVH